MPRLPDFDALTLDREQKQFVDQLHASRWGALRGPFQVLIHTPQIAQAFEPLAAHLRFDDKLPARIREFIILMAASHWKSDHEWRSHIGPARAAGLSDDIIRALGERRGSATFGGDDRTLHEFCNALLCTGRVNDATFEKALDLFGLPALIDISTVLGFYTTIGFLLNAFMPEEARDVDLPWQPPPAPE